MNRIAPLIISKVPFIIGMNNTHLGLDIWAAFAHSDEATVNVPWSYRSAGLVFSDLSVEDIYTIRTLIMTGQLVPAVKNEDGAIYEFTEMPFKEYYYSAA